MPIPSLLWSAPLEDSAKREPAVPESTLSDLLADGEIRARSLPVLRLPCLPEEIPPRQELIMGLLESEDFADYADGLRLGFSEAEQLFDEISRAENEDEKILLFLPAMNRFFTLAEELARFDAHAPEGTRKAREIADYWQKYCENVAHAAHARRCRDLLARQDPKLTLRIHGSQVSAWERRRGIRADLEESLRDMGFEDAIPADRHPQKASEPVIAGYGGVYASYFQSASAFWEECFGDYVGGERDMTAVFRYREELEFLLDVTAYFRSLRDAGYPLCCPEVSSRREFVLTGLVDPSLRRRNVPGNEVVPNDLRMTDGTGEGSREQFFILSGANGGGKTTFLRASALAALFFSAGCPVAAREGRGMPFDAVYTHFPSNESFENSGRFADEAERADEIEKAATDRSFAVFNETFSGTDEKRSEEFSARLAGEMWRRGVFGIYVTHIHALTGGEIPTLAAVVDENDDNRRTYKIRRVGATASSFAQDILEQYGLDGDTLAARIAEIRAESEKGGN